MRGTLFFTAILVATIAFSGCNSPDQIQTPTPMPTVPTPVDLNGMSYAQLAALGIPIECNKQTNAGTAQITSLLRLKGNEARLDATTKIYVTGVNYVEVKSTEILKNGSTYVPADVAVGMDFENMNLTDCNWVYWNNAKPPKLFSENLETTNMSGYSCSQKSLSSSIFDTPGTLCEYVG